MRPFLALLLMLVPAQAAEFSVSTQGELNAALASAVPGDTITISGSFSAVLSGAQYPGFVDVTGQVTGITADNLAFVRFRDMQVDGRASFSSSADIEIVRNIFRGPVDTYNGHGLHVTLGAERYLIEDNDLAFYENCWRVDNLNNSIVRGNTCDRVGGDSYKFLGSASNTLVEMNEGARYYHNVTGAHHDFMQFQGGIFTGWTVHRNWSLIGVAPGVSAQGIFSSNAQFENSQITENVIVHEHGNCINYVGPSNGTLVEFNTCLNIPGGSNDLSDIKNRTGSITRNNVHTADDAASVGISSANNHRIYHGAAASPLTYGEYYTGPVAAGNTLADLVPVPGSPAADQVGAFAFLSGQTPPPPPPETDMLEVIAIVCGLGTAVIEVDETVTYTPPVDFVGTDTCDYTIEKNNDPALQASATLTITVADTLPIANDDAANTTKNTPVNVDVLANDQVG